MQNAAVIDAPAHVHHDDRTFVQKYIFTTDHKIIGIQFLFMSLAFMFVGGVLAGIMRWQLGLPSEALPGGAILGETRAPGGSLLPEFYNPAGTMHGTLMDSFAIMPLLVAVSPNYLIPFQ